ncbi:hypothetical protein GCM10007036_12710 [Alsobacter metallidurans]|uniref:DUF6968 domain-containing protein n=1 Tax=Alsobacter metallidurans TaxID=340221 RepID=A0A917I666_9HYPH|nr:hypothetical protein [Alsobacter metallidurans]GGH13840.1 hypothetical protein GCM10007036_12710 [Alsobacter metallidurans]
MIITQKVIDIIKSSDEKVTVSIFAPERLKKDWSCRYEIQWPNEKTTRRAHGLDSAQALVLAIYMVGTDLYCSDFHKNGRMVVEGRPGGFGFPIPRIIRDDIPGYEDM